ncbi:MAG TPA: NADP-dependent oxidoreductase [Terriglobia bacterium]|nr:NADP-dependent oxidoreductase [Terriglobia bacterium]
MNAIRLHARGGAEALVYEQAPTPRPGTGELLVRVHAAAVTPTELGWAPTWTTRAGEPRPFPIIPGHEFSGEISALGTGVSGLAIGDAIFGMNDWFGDGTQAEYCVARAVDVAIKPRSVDHVLAAMTPISALTAWQGLIERAHLAPGERVLVHGGAGSVGLFAIQLAHWRGANVIATASARNLEFVRGLGAAEVIDYRVQRFEEVAQGMDVIFDTVGGDTLARSWSLLRPNGRLITIAASSEQAREQSVQDAFFIVEPNRLQLGNVANMIDAGKLQPVVSAAYPLADARRAYEHKPLRGKVVLTIVK